MNFIKRAVITTAVFLIYAQVFPGQLFVASFGVAVVGALVLGAVSYTHLTLPTNSRV